MVMATPMTCPACDHGAPQLLSNVSSHRDVTYYRCETCGHVWVVFKDGSVHHVMPLREQAGAS